MKLALAAVLILLSGSVALAVVGGGDITLKNKGGDTVFSHETHVEGAGLKCQDATRSCTPMPSSTRRSP